MNFTPEQLELVKATLLKNGIPEDVVNFSLNELSQGEDEAPKGVDSAEQNPDLNDVEEPVEEEPVGEDVPAEEPIPPVEGSESNAGEKPIPQEEPIPAEEQLPPVAPYDDTELKTLIGEQAKVIEGLTARIQSLEEALVKSGVIEKGGETNPVGGDNPQNIENTNVVENSMDDALRLLNGHKY